VDEIKWTAETPAENGFYWLRRKSQRDVIVEVDDIDEGIGATVSLFCSEWVPSLNEVLVDTTCTWAGPLKTPK
jgi:hypothetical protein